MPGIVVNKEAHHFTLKNQTRYFNFGLDRMLSSWLWIDTLLDSDTDQYKKNDLNSWMFLRFDLILNYDPKFLEAYQYAGQYLSIIKDDDLGAAEIFNKGLLVYPNDYLLNYHGAFHYFSELNNYPKAIELYLKIKDYPQSPVFLPALIASLMNKNNEKKDKIIELLEESKKNCLDEKMKQYYQKKINSLRAKK